MHTGMREGASERTDDRVRETAIGGKTQIAVYRDEQEMNAEGEKGRKDICIYVCVRAREMKREREKERNGGAIETQLGPVRGPVNKYQRYANKVNRSIV